ncbi:MAG: TRAP transporter small permease subunit [Deferrisomatales bacterium]|nr:TRAP transporter small permease subunit [Deferrisomatales bacterium]
MRRVLSAIDALSMWSGKAVSILTLLVALVIVYETTVRTFFLRPTVWAAEATVFACGLVYVIGGAWTMLEDKHVRIDLLYSRLSPRGRATINTLSFSFFALYVGVMLWATTAYALDSLQLRETLGTAWDPPIYPIKLALAFSFLLLLLQGIARFIRDLHLALTGRAL